MRGHSSRTRVRLAQSGPLCATGARNGLAQAVELRLITDCKIDLEAMFGVVRGANISPEGGYQFTHHVNDGSSFPRITVLSSCRG